MKHSPLLMRAAGPSLARIRRDRRRVPERLEPLLTYLEEHLFDPGICVTKLRRDCGVRNNSIFIRFTSILGRTPYAYIEDRRLETACRLLLETELKIWQIAELLGYSSLQVFSRAFTRWSELRPTAYRRRYAASRPGRLPPADRGQPPLDRERIAAIRVEEAWAELGRRPARARRGLLERLQWSAPDLARTLLEKALALMGE